MNAQIDNQGRVFRIRLIEDIPRDFMIIGSTVIVPYYNDDKTIDKDTYFL